MEVVRNHLDLKNLSVELNWLGLSQVDKIQLNSGRPVINPFWQVRRLEKKFSNWWQKKNKVSIFFGGASVDKIVIDANICVSVCLSAH